MKFDIWVFFENCVQKIQVPLTSDKTLHEDQFSFLSYLAGFFLEWEEMFATEVIEKIETHISYLTFYRKSRSFEIVW